MNNEWKELDIANLPPDILVGDYEFAHTDKHIPCTSFVAVEILRNGLNGNKYYYRKRALKAPTHEEIMTKWWKINYGDEWHKVTAFYPRSNEYVICESRMPFDFFLNRESADIPPEN